MLYNEIQMYERNKNILFEDVENPFWVKIAGKICKKITTYKRGSTLKQPKVVFSERVVEYPLLFQYISSDPNLRLLDFGCVEDLLPIHLASLGYKVTGLDYRPYPFKHSNFEFIQADILLDKLKLSLNPLSNYHFYIKDENLPTMKNWNIK